MARTAVDLPDPQPTPADGGANNADDLLAQLAGEEVDRLLSEAEGAAETAGPVKANRDRAAAKGGKGEAESSLDALFGDLDDAEKSALAEGEGAKEGAGTEREKPAAAESRAKAEPVPEPKVAAPAVAQSESSADALAAEMEEDDRAHAAAVQRMKGGSAAAAAEAAVAMPEVPAPLESAVAIDEGESVEPEEAQGVEVDAAMPFDDPAGRAEDGGVMIDEVELDAPTPLLVLLLEWLNAPLAGLPDGVRRAVGTVAIVTTVNAIGVIAYVLLFRRHGL